MAQRPYFNKGIDFLEPLFDSSRDDEDALRVLLNELEHRHTPRALELKRRVIQALGTMSSDQGAKDDVKFLAVSDVPQEGFSFEDDDAPTSSPEPEPSALSNTPYEIQEVRPKPSLNNAPTDILSSWTAMEVLLPNSYKKRYELAPGRDQSIASFERGDLPWAGKGERSRPEKKLFYHVVLGAIFMDKAEGCLLKAFQDKRPERWPAQGCTPIAIVTVDQKGCLVEDDPVLVSSFAWGLPLASQGDLESLGLWPRAEVRLNAGLIKRLSKYDEDDNKLALTRDDLEQAFAWLAQTLDLRAFLVEGPSFTLRVYQWFRKKESPSKPLINSFYLNDLAQARTRISDGTAGMALRRYLGLEAIEDKIDLLKDQEALEAVTAPVKTPMGRWPGRGRHSLVLLQQAAVNIAREELQVPGIVGINGPPGTGKTTLLRDLVASVLVERANALAAFDDPEKAFIDSKQKIKRGAASCHLYKLDSTVKGHEMLVTSSNNKAVENISKEMPAQDALAEDSDLTYFKTISDETAGPDQEDTTWGLIAAVLGNANNRFEFSNAMWNNDDTSLKHYLMAAQGSNVNPIEEKDADTGEITERPPHILVQENIPSGPVEAAANWRKARKDFWECQKKVKKQLSSIDTARRLHRDAHRMKSELEELEDNAGLSRSEANETKEELDVAEAPQETAAQDRRSAQSLVDTSTQLRPGLFARLFRTQSFKDWRAAHNDLLSACRTCVLAEQKARETFQNLQRAYHAIMAKVKSFEAEAHAQRSRIAKAEQAIVEVRELIGPQFADDDFWNRKHAELQKDTPWLSSDVQRLRDDTFEAAVRLHKAFIDAAAKPLRHNLMALFSVFRGTPLGAPEKSALLADLWATLFLVTPVISTTFASVERMIGQLPPQCLGWLFVDEAGQAVPQAAVGVMMRAKRALLVGDPLQIPPVVTLAPALVSGICQSFGVDADEWAAPQTSAQSLADNASRYGAELERDSGSIWIGAPLLVHRRCAEPMFSLSNRIAYNNLMVHAVAHKDSRIIDVLGKSNWIDVQGQASDKWCAQEGDAVMKILRRLHQGGVENPDIYIISPFRLVMQGMRDLIRKDEILLGNLTDTPKNWVSERIGTVHTFQGKEAEAVILLLGAPNANQTGARNWASGEPNLLNVAATRAKSALYVVGARERWRTHGHFKELDRWM